MSIRIIPGEIDAKDATTRTPIPSSAQSRWPPFERVAETIATPRRRFPPHRHEGVEVLTHGIEGSGTYEFGSDPIAPFEVGSTALLTAPTPVSHSINPGKGRTLRWFSVVATLPEGRVAAPRLQMTRSAETPVQADGTVVRHLLGAGTSVTSIAGLEGELIEFREGGTSFRRIGHDREAVCYALSGQGSVDSAVLEGGEAALVSDAAGIGLGGRTGFRAVLVSAPRSP